MTDLTGIGTGLTAVKDIIGMFFPDKTAEDQAKLTATLQMIQGQMQVDLASAQKQSFTFRDGAGWTCVVAFALMALKAPIEWVCAISGHPISLPAVDTSVTTDMLLGLLGLGGMHMYEKTSS